MGDANADAETRIANSGTNLQVDILKVGHHGSATSTTQSSFPKFNRRSATYGRLAQVGSAVYRTDLNGDVTVTTDGSAYDVKTGLTSSQPIVGIAKTVTTQADGEFPEFGRSGLTLFKSSKVLLPSVP